MFFAVLWLVQDMLTVLLWGVTQVPELFLTGIVCGLLCSDGDDNLRAVWSAFAGGLLWDLRWIGAPGLFAIGYVAVVMIVLWVWNSLPVSGRTLGVVFMLLELAQILPSLLPVFVLGGWTGESFFIRQQLLALPVLMLCLYIMHRRKEAAERDF